MEHASMERLAAVGSPTLRPHVTKHALDRLVERFRKRLPREAVAEYETYGQRGPLRQVAEALFAEGEERRQILNDTKFMTYLYTTYGTEKRLSFRANGSMVFVCVEEHEYDRLCVVTVVDMEAGLGSYSPRNMGGRVKFRRAA